MRIVPVSCLRDNYAYLVIGDDGSVAVVDPSETEPVRDALEREGLRPTALWLTHHHWDHVGGVEGLCERYSALEVIGSTSDHERGRIPRQTRRVREGDTLTLGPHTVEVIENPGHTLGAVTYVVEGQAFTGDTLFVAGCGRVFEGSMEMMKDSMAKLRGLAPETRIWCGHEYTIKNLEFARTVEPDNRAVADALDEAKRARAAGEPTVPGTMQHERETNPFLRFDTPDVAQGRTPTETFTAVRKAKDRF